MGHAPAGCPRAVVAGHAGFPDGLVAAVERITGRGDTLVAFSNGGLGREAIEAGLRGFVERDGVRVIFTDLQGGSATFAARRVARDHPDVVVVTGANLPALLEFVFCTAEGSGAAEPDASGSARQPAQQSAQEAARRAAERGRASLAAFPG